LIVVVTEYAAPSAKKCCRGVKNNWPRVRTWWVKGLGFGLRIGDPWASGRVMGVMVIGVRGWRIGCAPSVGHASKVLKALRF